MRANRELLMDNFDERNIKELRSIIKKERTEGPRIKSAYTMVQKNAPCEINITEQSRKISVATLLD